MFEKATKKHFRYKSNKGLLTTEDLWDLTLLELDVIAKALNKEVKDSSEESFIAKTTTLNKLASEKLDVIKRIIEIKLEEAERKHYSAEKRQKKNEILELLSKKEAEKMGTKTEEELRKELLDLDDDTED